MADLPLPGADAPEDSLLVMSGDGRVVYRLLRQQGISRASWQPNYGVKAAAAIGVSELRRLAMSHYLSEDEANAVNTQGSRLARVTLEPGKFDFARTGQQSGHVDVWGRVEDFVAFAENAE